MAVRTVMFVGHFGITLLLCAPLANGLVTSGHRVEVPRWVGIALAVTMLPDFDVFLPWVTHRGITHSVLAAVCLGVGVAIVATVRWNHPLESSEETVRRAVLGFTVGTGSVAGHLVGDLITPMGIRPFVPVDTVYTLDLVGAKNVEANLALVLLGVVVFFTAYSLSKDPAPIDEPAATELAESDVHPLSQ